jgi:hypothetical protein
MKKWKILIIMSLISFFVISLYSERFTKSDAVFVKKYADDWDQDDEFEEEDAPKMVKYLENKYEVLLRDENNKKIALELMQRIEHCLQKAKKELKEENWNSAGAWAVVGMVWIKSLDYRHQVVNSENYFKQLKKSK